jgi:hypothetical protein
MQKNIDQLDRSCEKRRSITSSKGKRNTLHTIKRRTANWIRHILRTNCLLKHATEEKIEDRIKRREDEEEEVSSYWMTLKEREGTRI